MHLISSSPLLKTSLPFAADCSSCRGFKCDNSSAAVTLSVDKPPTHIGRLPDCMSFWLFPLALLKTEICYINKRKVGGSSYETRSNLVLAISIAHNPSRIRANRNSERQSPGWRQPADCRCDSRNCRDSNEIGRQRGGPIYDCRRPTWHLYCAGCDIFLSAANGSGDGFRGSGGYSGLYAKTRSPLYGTNGGNRFSDPWNENRIQHHYQYA